MLGKGPGNDGRMLALRKMDGRPRMTREEALATADAAWAAIDRLSGSVVRSRVAGIADAIRSARSPAAIDPNRRARERAKFKAAQAQPKPKHLRTPTVTDRPDPTYWPHQSDRELTRRKRQLACGQLKP